MNILYIGNKLMKHGLSATSIETLGPLLEKEGFNVFYSSDKKRQFIRLLDMLWSVFKFRKSVEYVLIDTYSRRSFYGVLFVSFACRLFNLKYISVLRGGSLPQRLNQSPRLTAIVFKNAYKLISPSGYLQAKFREKGFESTIISNNIPIKNYIFKSRSNVSPKLLWVRSFHRIYNPGMAVQILNQLKKRYLGAKLCMVGPDRDESMLLCKRSAAELGLNNDVEFTGNLTKKEWHKLSEEYDIFINTTNIDNTPVSVIEALALGLPVVSTNVGGLPYLLNNNEDALLVDPDDVDKMVMAICRLIDNPTLTEQLTVNGRRKAENFDWERIREKWIDVLKEPNPNKTTILYLGNKLSKHGLPVSVIETLGPQLEDLGYKLYYSSEFKNRILRLAHMIYSLLSKRNRVDKVLIDTYSKYGFWYVYIAGVICQRFNIPYYPILHGGKLPLRLEKNPKLCKTVFSNSKVNIAPSDFLKEVFLSKGFNINYIPNNIDLGLYKYKLRDKLRPKLLFVRNFNKLYNPVMAIEVIRRLKNIYPDAELCMVGPDSKNDSALDECKYLVDKYNLKKSVTFTGILPKTEWHKLSEGYDIFINTTNVDNTPVSIIEALALGFPVVSTNVGGIPYLLEDGVEGMLVNKGDVEEMLNVIISLLNDKSLPMKLSVNGRRKAERFDWNIVKKQWDDILSSN